MRLDALTPGRRFTTTDTHRTATLLRIGPMGCDVRPTGRPVLVIIGARRFWRQGPPETWTGAAEVQPLTEEPAP